MPDEKLCSCGKATKVGSARCAKCISLRETKAMQQRQRSWLAAGLCRQCGRPKVAGKTRCQKCINRTRNKRIARSAAGQCIRCGVAATAGKYCLDHWFLVIGSFHGFNGRNGGLLMLKHLWQEQKGLCAVTGEPLTPGLNASLDHDIPRSRGGSNAKHNLRWVRLEINTAKMNLTHIEFVELCRKVIARADRNVTCRAAEAS